MLRMTLLQSFQCFVFLADATAYSLARFGQGSGPIYLDEVMCTGTETMLGACSANPIGTNDCSHREDAGVGCQSKSKNFFLTCMGL